MSWFKEKCWLVDITKRINNKGGYPEADLLEVVHYPPASPPAPTVWPAQDTSGGQHSASLWPMSKDSPSQPLHRNTLYFKHALHPSQLPIRGVQDTTETNVAVCCTKFILLPVQLKESGENPSWNKAMHCILKPHGDDWGLTHHPHTTACQLRAFVEFGQSHCWQ